MPSNKTTIALLLCFLDAPSADENKQRAIWRSDVTISCNEWTLQPFKQHRMAERELVKSPPHNPVLRPHACAVELRGEVGVFYHVPLATIWMLHADVFAFT